MTDVQATDSLDSPCVCAETTFLIGFLHILAFEYCRIWYYKLTPLRHGILHWETLAPELPLPWLNLSCSCTAVRFFLFKSLVFPVLAYVLDLITVWSLSLTSFNFTPLISLTNVFLHKFLANHIPWWCLFSGNLKHSLESAGHIRRSLSC